MLRENYESMARLISSIERSAYQHAVTGLQTERIEGGVASDEESDVTEADIRSQESDVIR